MAAFDPNQRARQTVQAEQEAKQVAAALEALRRQLDPTRQALQGTTKAAGAFAGVVGGMQSIASMGGQPAAAIASFGGGLSKVLSLAGPWGQAAGVFVSTLSQMPQLFKSAGDSMANFVAKFSPATAGRWTQAWDDLSAAIGSYLVPVLELATGVVRYFGDAIAGWQVVFQPVIDQMSQMVGLYGSAFGDVTNSLMEFAAVTAQVMVPFLQVVIEIGAGPLKLCVDLLGQFADWLRQVAQQLALFFGIDMPRFKGSSAGMAARGTGTSTVQNMLTQLQQRAFALGGGPGKKEDPAAKSANILLQIHQWLTQTLPNIIGNKAMEIWNNIVQAIGRLATSLARVGI